MSQRWWEDDNQLLAALREALRSERNVPAEFTATGKAAFAWPTSTPNSPPSPMTQSSKVRKRDWLACALSQQACAP